jgi:tRNA dimethylallyltransferase
MVGGTGLYVDGVIYDYGFLEEGDRQAREILNQLSISELLDTIAALNIPLGDTDVRNKRRLIRLIETNGAQATKQELRPNTLIVGIQTEREVLKDAITRRVDAMLEAGLEAEVETLQAKYGWNCEALKGVGYAQWKEYFLGAQSLEETRRKIIKATLDLAKRQRTWFKRNKSIHWFTTPVNYTHIVDSVTTFLDK